MEKSLEKRTVSSLNPSDRASAKAMFLKYCSISEISRKFNVPRTSLSYYAHKYWKPEREMMKAEIFAQFTETKRVHFTRISEATIKVMTRALEELANRDQPPTVAEAKKAAEIQESLDKISRLDNGDPTEIVSEKPSTIIEIKEKLRLDPFYQEEVIDAENVKEITGS